MRKRMEGKEKEEGRKKGREGGGERKEGEGERWGRGEERKNALIFV